MTTAGVEPASVGGPGRPDGEEALRVLVVDDQALFRRGLQLVLSGQSGIELVGEAANGREAVDKARELAPDVVLMDVRMPVMNGIEAARFIRRDLPSTRILMLTVSDEERDLYDAVRAGANGYLLKEVSVDEVVEGIRAVGRGHSLISPAMATKLLVEFNALAERAESGPQLPGPTLTGREVEVLRMVAKAMSNREIAQALYISENTVKNHVRNILDKLHLHNRMEAVLYAVKQRLLDVDQG